MACKNGILPSYSVWGQKRREQALEPLILYLLPLSLILNMTLSLPPPPLPTLPFNITLHTIAVRVALMYDILISASSTGYYDVAAFRAIGPTCSWISTSVDQRTDKHKGIKQIGSFRPATLSLQSPTCMT